MTRGQVVIIDADIAKASKDLLEALRIGAVSIRYIAKCRYEAPAPKQPSPPWLAGDRMAYAATPNLAPAPPQNRVAPPPPTQEGAANVDDALRALEGMVAKQVEAKVEELRKEFAQKGTQPPTPASPVVATIEDVDDDVPMFIPSGLVDAGGKRVEVETTEESADELGEAAAALRSMRREKDGEED
jgi:hypothetical protein